MASVPEDFRGAVRYQTVDGNLGKVDHVVVLMLENRSFDHMLGYLSLQGRGEANGLAASQVGTDGTGHDPNIVFRLGEHRPADVPVSMFTTDPGHGWADVAEQLEFDITTGLSNSGFSRNFDGIIQQIGATSGRVRDEGTLARGAARSVLFRPAQDSLTIQCTPSWVPPSSTSGNLAEIAIRSPAAFAPVATAPIPLQDAGQAMNVGLPGADLQTDGKWIFEVTNAADQTITFTTEITPVQPDLPVEPAGAVMGYYDDAQLPVYNMLAENFTICDAWFASLPTDTWPNRLYALAGGSGGLDTTPSDASVATDPPGYSLTTIFEILQQRGVDWKMHYSDLPFALIFKALAQDAAYTQRMRPLSRFFADAKGGNLASVTWIDPSFLDVEETLGHMDLANDDHPPGDVARGQHFVWQIYDALSHSPSWSKTLLIITYDEHGGFYDHVLPPGTSQVRPAPGHFTPVRGTVVDPVLGSGQAAPAPATPVPVRAVPVTPAPAAPAPAAPVRATSVPADSGPDVGPPDDDPRFRRYGVRVPAFVVSPWAAPGSAGHETYDHTSILATILRRFCSDGLPSMGQRTDHANDVGSLLSGDAPRPAPAAQEPGVQPVTAFGPQDERVSFGAVLRQALFGL